jgi:hypothetical protein
VVPFGMTAILMLALDALGLHPVIAAVADSKLTRRNERSFIVWRDSVGKHSANAKGKMIAYF